MAEHLQDSNDQQLCRNCHDFYGSPQTNFLCSLCFKKASAPMPPPRADPQVLAAPPQLVSVPEEAKVSAPADPSRCFKCKKRFGVTRHKCQCGETFCTNCLQPEVHLCGIDYRAQATRKLSENNPQVIAEKVSKI